MAKITSVSQGHTGLTIRGFAQRATVLVRHPDRVVTLFGKVAAIRNDDTILSAQGGTDLVLMSADNQGILPRTGAGELLHRLHVAAG